MEWGDTSDLGGFGSYSCFLFNPFFLRTPLLPSNRGTTTFYSQTHPKPNVKWCDQQGSVGPRPSPSMVSSGQVFASPRDVIFRDPPPDHDSSLGNSIITMMNGKESFLRAKRRRYCHSSAMVLIAMVLMLGNIFDHIKEHLRGGSTILLSPLREFLNSPSCEKFKEFIGSTIKERVRTGSLLFWGFVGQFQPPHLVMPITVEPNKPRMCHDFLTHGYVIFHSHWITYPISQLCRSGHFQTVCDDKSGYDHILLTPASVIVLGDKTELCNKKL